MLHSILPLHCTKQTRSPFFLPTTSTPKIISSRSKPLKQCSSFVGAGMASDVGNSEDILVQYVVMRRDLIENWPMGSIIAQGCHAAVAAVWMHRDDPHTSKYCGDDNLDKMHKVTLEVKGEAQLINLSEKLKGSDIAHKLWIEQPENIPTCLATKPYPKTLVASFFKKLKLCK